MHRVILHSDLNNFFASVELLDRPDLRDKPVAVCGDAKMRHGIILAKNDVAKKFGVQTAETIWQAQRKCPNLILLSGQYDKYSYWSKRVNALYYEYTNLVEPFGVDESWMDITGSLALFQKDGLQIAQEIRQRIKMEFGLTVSIGVSFNKVFAKLGSDLKKPDAVSVISPENFKQVVWPLPADTLLFVGKATAARLKKFGIYTIGDVAQLDEGAAAQLLGKQGPMLCRHANGKDDACVAPAGYRPPPKSVGNGKTFSRDLVGEQEMKSAIFMLSDRVAARLRRHHMKCNGVQLSIRTPQFHDESHRIKCMVPTDLGREIAEMACVAMRQCWNFSHPVRAITVTAISLVHADDAGAQMNLFCAQEEKTREKFEKLELTVDEIRNRFGRGAITLASTAEEMFHRQ